MHAMHTGIECTGTSVFYLHAQGSPRCALVMCPCLCDVRRAAFCGAPGGAMAVQLDRGV
jgi:hypothetical protein